MSYCFLIGLILNFPFSYSWCILVDAYFSCKAFHTTTAQGLFFSTKRARPDIHTGIAFLCTQVQDPNEEDWEKIIQLMKYLNGTRNLVLTLHADKLNILKWYVDSSFAVHADFKSHTGVAMTMGKGAMMSMS